MKKVLIFFIGTYRLIHVAFFSHCCRFHPTCSNYAIEAIKAHGIIKGLFLAFLRILRCNPFFKGGWDPVPINKQVTKNCIERENCG